MILSRDITRSGGGIFAFELAGGPEPRGRHGHATLCLASIGGRGPAFRTRAAAPFGRVARRASRHCPRRPTDRPPPSHARSPSRPRRRRRRRAARRRRSHRPRSSRPAPPPPPPPRDRDRVSRAPGPWRMIMGGPRCIARRSAASSTASTRSSHAVPGSTSPATCVPPPPRAHRTRRLAPPAPPRRRRRRRNRRRRRRGVPIGNRGSESGRYPRPRRAVSSRKCRSS